MKNCLFAFGSRRAMCWVIATAWIVCTGGQALAVSARTVAHGRQKDLNEVARSVPPGGTLRIEGVAIDGSETALELERIEAFTSDAKIVVAGRNGEVVLPAPNNAYYRGAVEGDVGAVAVLTGREAGGMRGLIMKNGVPYVISDEDTGNGVHGLSTRKVDMKREFSNRKFRCGATDQATDVASLTADSGDLIETAAATATVNYTARIAVDTDFEFYQRFGNVTDATDYIGDLFAYASTIYENEVNTSLAVSYVKLWTTSTDPWTSTTCDTALSQFRNYWIQNNSGVSRTLTHMLSGKSTGCGIGYIGVLCNSSYGYALSGSLAGNFNILNPGVVWDILVVSHEIGHNFNSPHTHCYNGIGGEAQPVDGCYSGESGCYSGTPTLPCSAGGKCGTIMSYCHLLSGGYGNITMTFGTGFQYGVSPGRVPSRMQSHVLTQANNNPSCLAYQAPAGSTPTAVANTPTMTPTRTSTSTPTRTPTMTPTRTNTIAPTNTPVSANTHTPTPANTSTQVVAATSTPTRSSTSTPTTARTATPTATKRGTGHRR